MVCMFQCTDLEPVYSIRMTALIFNTVQLSVRKSINKCVCVCRYVCTCVCVYLLLQLNGLGLAGLHLGLVHHVV